MKHSDAAFSYGDDESPSPSFHYTAKKISRHKDDIILAQGVIAAEAASRAAGFDPAAPTVAPFLFGSFTLCHSCRHRAGPTINCTTTPTSTHAYCYRCVRNRFGLDYHAVRTGIQPWPACPACAQTCTCPRCGSAKAAASAARQRSLVAATVAGESAVAAPAGNLKVPRSTTATAADDDGADLAVDASRAALSDNAASEAAVEAGVATLKSAMDATSIDHEVLDADVSGLRMPLTPGMTVPLFASSDVMRAVLAKCADTSSTSTVKTSTSTPYGGVLRPSEADVVAASETNPFAVAYNIVGESPVAALASLSDKYDSAVALRHHPLVIRLLAPWGLNSRDILRVLPSSDTGANGAHDDMLESQSAALPSLTSTSHLSLDVDATATGGIKQNDHQPAGAHSGTARARGNRSRDSKRKGWLLPRPLLANTDAPLDLLPPANSAEVDEGPQLWVTSREAPQFSTGVRGIPALPPVVPLAVGCLLPGLDVTTSSSSGDGGMHERPVDDPLQQHRAVAVARMLHAAGTTEEMPHHHSASEKQDDVSAAIAVIPTLLQHRDVEDVRAPAVGSAALFSCFESRSEVYGQGSSSDGDSRGREIDPARAVVAPQSENILSPLLVLLQRRHSTEVSAEQSVDKRSEGVARHGGSADVDSNDAVGNLQHLRFVGGASSASAYEGAQLSPRRRRTSSLSHGVEIEPSVEVMPTAKGADARDIHASDCDAFCSHASADLVSVAAPADIAAQSPRTDADVALPPPRVAAHSMTSVGLSKTDGARAHSSYSMPQSERAGEHINVSTASTSTSTRPSSPVGATPPLSARSLLADAPGVTDASRSHADPEVSAAVSGSPAAVEWECSGDAAASTRRATSSDNEDGFPHENVTHVAQLACEPASDSTQANVNSENATSAVNATGDSIPAIGGGGSILSESQNVAVEASTPPRIQQPAGRSQSAVPSQRALPPKATASSTPPTKRPLKLSCALCQSSNSATSTRRRVVGVHPLVPFCESAVPLLLCERCLASILASRRRAASRGALHDRAGYEDLCAVCGDGALEHPGMTVTCCSAPHCPRSYCSACLQDVLLSRKGLAAMQSTDDWICPPCQAVATPSLHLAAWKRLQGVAADGANRKSSGHARRRNRDPAAAKGLSAPGSAAAAVQGDAQQQHIVLKKRGRPPKIRVDVEAAAARDSPLEASVEAAPSAPEPEPTQMVPDSVLEVEAQPQATVTSTVSVAAAEAGTISAQALRPARSRRAPDYWSPGRDGVVAPLSTPLQRASPATTAAIPSVAASVGSKAAQGNQSRRTVADDEAATQRPAVVATVPGADPSALAAVSADAVLQSQATPGKRKSKRARPPQGSEALSQSGHATKPAKRAVPAATAIADENATRAAETVPTTVAADAGAASVAAAAREQPPRNEWFFAVAARDISSRVVAARAAAARRAATGRSATAAQQTATGASEDGCACCHDGGVLIECDGVPASVAPNGVKISAQRCTKVSSLQMRALSCKFEIASCATQLALYRHRCVHP